MKKALLTLALLGLIASPAAADIVSNASGLQVSTEVWNGNMVDFARDMEHRVPSGELRDLTGNPYDARFLGQSTLGGAGFLEDGSGAGAILYDGNQNTVGAALLPGGDTLTVQEFEVLNPASQPLAAKQIQIQLSSTLGLDLLPLGFNFGTGNPIDLYRFDSGGFAAGTNAIDPDEAPFDVIDAFFVLLDVNGAVLSVLNMVNGVTAGATGVTTLSDASITGAGQGATDIIQVWNITPEPGTLALLGLGGMLLIRRRR